MTNSYNDIYDVVCQIPAGSVATYGQIARLINRPRGARLVGYALAALNNNSHVPWHRVINSQGNISPRKAGGYDEFQRLLLEDEGIMFDDSGRVDLSKFLWDGPANSRQAN